MSRSYKKNPIVKDNNKSKKYDKQLANRKVRRKLKNPEYELADGNAYQKIYESWNIADFVSRWTEDEARAHYDRLVNGHVERWPGERERFIEAYPTLDKWMNYWKKCMKRK